MKTHKYLIDFLGIPSNLAFLVGQFSVITQCISWSIKFAKKNIWISSGLIVVIVVLLVITFNFIQHHIAKRKVKQFYSNIKAKSFDKAWNILSSEIKDERWNDEFSLFENGFIHTKDIEVLGVHSDHKLRSKHQFIVLYRDQVSCCQIEGLEQMQQKQIKEVDQVAQYIHNLERKLAQNLPTDTLTNLKLSDFFKPNFSDMVRWQYKHDHLNTIMDEQRQLLQFINMRRVTISKRTFLSRYKISQISDVN